LWIAFAVPRFLSLQNVQAPALWVEKSCQISARTEIFGNPSKFALPFRAFDDQRSGLSMSTQNLIKVFRCSW